MTDWQELSSRLLEIAIFAIGTFGCERTIGDEDFNFDDEDPPPPGGNNNGLDIPGDICNQGDC